MKDIISFVCRQSDPPGSAGHNQLEDMTTYMVGSMMFIVEPRFKESGKETISTILIKLMKFDGMKK